MKHVKLFIGNEFKESSSGDSFETADPCTGEVIAKCELPSTSDIDLAVNAAKSAFYNPEWKNMTQDKRAELLLAISDKLKERKKEFIEMEIKDSGSLPRKAIADLHNTASFFKVMSKVAKNLKLEELDENASRDGFSKNYRLKEPVGVCAQIIPWNFPLVMAAWKIGPILATGCTTVLKTAKETPVTAIMLAEVLKDVGVPAGVINIITGDAKEGKALIEHKDVSKVAFTGSTEVGRKIMESTASTIKNVTMELGGKSANIILEDADLDIAVDGALYAFVYHSGQACDSGTRLLISDKIYDQFLDKLLARVKDIKIGPTTDKSSSLGPVINETQANRIMSFIDKTKSEGAKLLTGGNKIELNCAGHFIEPTFFEITPDNTIFHEEIFGPVCGITKFSTIDEALTLANNSEYGLAAGVWSKDNKQAMDVAKRIEAGTVWINEYHLLNPGMPFGGYKQSGVGREMGQEGIEAYLEVKHLWVSDCNDRKAKPWLDAIF